MLSALPAPEKAPSAPYSPTTSDIHHVSVGDHLRSLPELDAQQTFGGLPAERLSRLLRLRSLLPPTTIISIIDDAVDEIRKAAAEKLEAQIILVDGFPRCPDSAPLAHSKLGEPSKVLLSDCPRAVAGARFLERRRSDDDTVEVFRKRFDEFERLNGQVMDFYGDRAMRIGTETSTEVTWETLKGRVSGLLGEQGAVEREN